MNNNTVSFRVEHKEKDHIQFRVDVEEKLNIFLSRHQWARVEFTMDEIGHVQWHKPTMLENNTGYENKTLCTVIEQVYASSLI